MSMYIAKSTKACHNYNEMLLLTTPSNSIDVVLPIT